MKTGQVLLLWVALGLITYGLHAPVALFTLKLTCAGASQLLLRSGMFVADTLAFTKSPDP